MEEFVEKLKQGATKVIGEAEKLTNKAVIKTGNLVTKTKFNYAISTNEGKIKDILAEVGRSVYDEFKNGNFFPQEVEEKLKVVDTLYEEIAELKGKIADMENTILCPECGAYTDGESAFCSKCGAKIKE